MKDYSGFEVFDIGRKTLGKKFRRQTADDEHSVECFEVTATGVDCKELMAGMKILADYDGSDYIYLILEDDDLLELRKKGVDDLLERWIMSNAVSELGAEYELELIRWGIKRVSEMQHYAGYNQCKVIVAKKYHDYAPADFATSEDGKPLIFEHRTHAKAWIEKQNAQSYQLDFGEIARPEYLIHR